MSITNIIKKVANMSFIFLVKSESSPPHIPIEITPRTGIPTPVTKNPNKDRIHLSPARCPNVGGNIKFPAPKNIANNAKPKTIISLIFLFISRTLPVYPYRKILFILTHNHTIYNKINCIAQ